MSQAILDGYRAAIEGLKFNCRAVEIEITHRDREGFTILGRRDGQVHVRVNMKTFKPAAARFRNMYQKAQAAGIIPKEPPL